MKTLKELRELKVQKVKEMDEIVKLAAKENRDITDAEMAKIDALEIEITGGTDADGKTVEGIDQQIEKRSKVDKVAERRSFLNENGFQTGDPVGGDSKRDKKDLASYSVLKVIRSLLPANAGGEPLDGIEKEMHEEAIIEMRQIGQTITGIGIPSRIMQQRDNSITVATQPEDGSILVPKDVLAEPSMMEMLRNQLVCRQLGATYLNDLVGNVAFTRMTQRPKATWKSEIATLDKSNVKFASDELSPKRLGTYVIQSLQFLRQTSPAVERLIRQEITYSLAEGVDEAAIFGTGANNQPLGILNHTGIPAMAGLGTNGGNLSRGLLIALRTALLKRNIRPGGNVKWLMNAATEGWLANQPIATGSDKFILGDDNRLLGYPYVMSNIVPSDLDKGSATDTLSAIIFGAWAELYIAQWGGIDLLLDPYTLGTEGQIKIVAQGFFNTLVHRPEAFALYKDITTVLS